MKTITVAEFKTHFSEVIGHAKAGISFAVTYGGKKEVIGYFLSEPLFERQHRKLGLLEGKVTVKFQKDFQLNEADLLE